MAESYNPLSPIASTIPAPTSVAVVAPAKVKVSTATAMTIVRGQVEETLTALGRNAKEAQQQIAKFMQALQPDIEQAISEQDLAALEYMRERVVVMLARVSFGLLYREQQVVTAVVISVLKTIIKLAIL